jgi:acyl-CoA dehydrogenase
MSAVADGDDYVLNGSKIWTTMAHHANKMFCLVRTSREEKKQAGITFLLLDMNAPGIEVRAIRDLAGRHEFNQVYFTDVRVPRTGRLGDEGMGWAVARHLLTIEHSGSVFDSIEMRRRLTWLAEIARVESDGHGGSLFDDPVFAQRFAEAAVACEASDAMTARLVAQIREGEVAPGLVELTDIRRRELGQWLTELLMHATGHHGLPYQDAGLRVGGGPGVGPEHALLPTAFFLTQRAATIWGGTNEIHRNNVARHVLGL